MNHRLFEQHRLALSAFSTRCKSTRQAQRALTAGVVLTGLCGFGSVWPTPEAEAQSSAPVTVTVDVNARRQTIGGLGGNYANGYYVGQKVQSANGAATTMDGAGNVTLANLDPKMARVGIPLRAWEPFNKDDPNAFNLNQGVINGRGHRPTPYQEDGWLGAEIARTSLATDTQFPAYKEMPRAGLTNYFNRMKQLHTQNASMPLVASVWTAPDWMLEPVADGACGPTSGHPASNNCQRDRHLLPAYYGEFIESLVSFLVHAKQYYGVEIQFVSINEPDGGVRLHLTPAEYANIIKAAGTHFQDAGLSTKWAICETSSARMAVTYAEATLNRLTVAERARVGAISFHSWDANDLETSAATNPDYTRTWNNWNDLAAFVDPNSTRLGKGLPVFCNEVGYSGDLYNLNDFEVRLRSYDHALRVAAAYNRVFALTRTNWAAYWEYMNDFPLVSPQNSATHFAAYDVIDHIRQNLIPGATVVQSDSSNPVSVAPLALRQPATATGAISFVVQTIVASSASVPVTFRGLPNGQYSWQKGERNPTPLTQEQVKLKDGTTTSAPVDQMTWTSVASTQQPQLKVTNGTLTLSLPPNSINVLTGHLDQTPPIVNITGPSTSIVKSLTPLLGTARDAEGDLSFVELSLQQPNGKWWQNGQWQTAPSELRFRADAFTSAGGGWYRSQQLPTVGGAAGMADLPDGRYILTAYALDRAGNRGAQRREITVDNAPPTLDITQPAANTDLYTLQSIRGTASDVLSGISKVELSIQQNFGNRLFWISNGAVNNWAATGQTQRSTTFAPSSGEWEQTQGLPSPADLEAGQSYLITSTAFDKSNPANTNTVTRQVTAQHAQLSLSDAAVVEGDTGTVNVVFTLRLAPAVTFPVTVNFATSDGAVNAATSALDYTAQSGTVTFAPGTTTQTISVAVVGDTLTEADETFNLTLSGAANADILDGQGIGTITDDDFRPQVSVGDASVVEGNSGSTAMAFPVRLSAVSRRDVRIRLTTSGRLASSAAGDYTGGNYEVVIPAGSLMATVVVPVIGDTQIEADETFVVDITLAEWASILDGQGVGTIVNDDFPSLSIAGPGYIAENLSGGSTIFRVTLSAPSPQEVRVAYRTANGTALSGSDFVSTSGTLVFAPNETSKEIKATVVNDSLKEASESFFVDLGIAVNASVMKARGVATILAND